MSTELAVPALSMSGVRARFQTGVTFNVIGAVFNQGSTFVFNIVAANLLGRQVFGKYAMIQSTLTTLALVAQMSAGYTATKYVAEFRSTNPGRAGAVLGMLAVFSTSTAGAGALLLLSVSGWLARAALKAPEVSTALELGAAVLFLAVLNGLLMGALAGLESYRRLAIALVWSGIAYLVLCTGLTWGAGLTGAVGGLAVSGLLQCILLTAALRKECRLQGIRVEFTAITQERNILLKFTLPGALSGFTTMPALWLASTLLVRQPGGYSQMAIYSASFTLTMAVLFLPNIANNVGMSLINHFKGTGDLLGYRRTFWVNLAMTMGIVVFSGGLVALTGPWFLRLFGKNFRDGYPVLLTLLIATIPQGLATALYQVIQSHTKMWLSFFAVSLPRDTLVVALAYLWIPRSGAMGFATAYTLASTLALIATFVIACRTRLRVKSDLDIADREETGCDPLNVASPTSVNASG